MKRIIIVLAILGAILLSSSLYTVNETQVAIKLRLGEIVSVENKPRKKMSTASAGSKRYMGNRKPNKQKI